MKLHRCCCRQPPGCSRAMCATCLAAVEQRAAAPQLYEMVSFRIGERRRCQSHSLLICFLSLAISTSCFLKSAASVESRGIGPSTAHTNEACAERSAPGTRMPNQRMGSADRLMLAADEAGDASVPSPFSSTVAVPSAALPSAVCGPLVPASATCSSPGAGALSVTWNPPSLNALLALVAYGLCRWAPAYT